MPTLASATSTKSRTLSRTLTAHFSAPLQRRGYFIFRLGQESEEARYGLRASSNSIHRLMQVLLAEGVMHTIPPATKIVQYRPHGKPHISLARFFRRFGLCVLKVACLKDSMTMTALHGVGHHHEIALFPRLNAVLGTQFGQILIRKFRHDAATEIFPSAIRAIPRIRRAKDNHKYKALLDQGDLSVNIRACGYVRRPLVEGWPAGSCDSSPQPMQVARRFFCVLEGDVMSKPSKPTGSPNKKPVAKRPSKNLIFRRYRTVNGKVLDAHDYGYKAWPIHLK